MTALICARPFCQYFLLLRNVIVCNWRFVELICWNCKSVISYTIQMNVAKPTEEFNSVLLAVFIHFEQQNNNT